MIFSLYYGAMPLYEEVGELVFRVESKIVLRAATQNGSMSRLYPFGAAGGVAAEALS